MLQAIAEIRHFRKCLDISENAQSIEEIPELPRQWRKLQAFPEMPRQLRKFVVFTYLFVNSQKLGKDKC
jgi:hypothetical protein